MFIYFKVYLCKGYGNFVTNKDTVPIIRDLRSPTSRILTSFRIFPTSEVRSHLPDYNLQDFTGVHSNPHQSKISLTLCKNQNKFNFKNTALYDVSRYKHRYQLVLLEPKVVEWRHSAAVNCCRCNAYTPPADIQHDYGSHKGTNNAKVKRRKILPFKYT